MNKATILELDEFSEKTKGELAKVWYPYEFVSVRSIDSGIRILIIYDESFIQYMAYDSSLTIYDAIKEYRRKKK